jgi:hypothetical protein
MTARLPSVIFLLLASLPVRAAELSIARRWDEQALSAIRIDTPHPPAQARNLFSLSVCMYDAWAAYDTNGAVGFIYRQKHTGPSVADARRTAISYAAYRILRERHAYSRTATNTLPMDDSFMASLGYNINNQTRNPADPIGVGNSIYDAVSAWFLNDGSRQTNGTPYPLANPPVSYPGPSAAEGGYIYINPPANPFLFGITDGTNHTVVDINHWQRLIVANSVDQNGFPQNPLQVFQGQQWLGVRPFALARLDPTKPWIDPGPPPLLGGPSDSEVKSNAVEVIRRSSELSSADGVTMDISPGAFGNNTLGANDGHGYETNSVTGLPYASNVVLRGDFARVLAEFWADGPNSETPPGHWNVIANSVADDSRTVKRIGGTGPLVDNLEWDVKVYFALNAALHDAACAAWSLKRYYDGWRPISVIRYLGENGQSSDPQSPSFSTKGLPLIPDLIELVTTETVASGRHAKLTPGKIAVRSWPGQPGDPVKEASGVRWIHAESWTPFQRKTFVTPAFPGYISGHSTFSRAAAEVLTGITGSPYFPGGLGSATVSRLSFEAGPAKPVVLQWASYSDAADQAGLSRIWGGIHPPIDDFTGRRVGSQVGKMVWTFAQQFFDGSISKSASEVSIRRLDPGNQELRFSATRSLYYRLQSTTDLVSAFTDEESAAERATEGWIVRTNAASESRKFYRVRTSLDP